MLQKRTYLPNIYILNDFFYYDETSPTCLRWKFDRPGKIKKDDIAGKQKDSYSRAVLDNKKYLVHRIIWKLYYKIEPPEIIDHIDGNTKNNKIENLREATPKQNCLNIKIPKHNTTGVMGVYWMKNKNKWKVEIRHSNGDLKYYGSFSNFETAKDLANEIRNKEYGEWVRKI